MKNEYELKIQNLRKDLAYYRDSNTKKEKFVKGISKFKKSINNEKEKNFDGLKLVTRKI